MIRRRITALEMVWIFLLLAAGCGSGERRMQISGIVTLDGVPLAQGAISLRPSGGKGPTAGALIVNGRYTVQVAPGKKIVEIQGYKQVGQQRTVEDDPSSPLEPKMASIVPAKYNTQTTLTIDVEKSDKNADFALRGQ